MKELLQQFAAYNLWANKLLLHLIGQLSKEQQTQVVPSSFNTLLKTVMHMWDAEAIWWQRVKLSERIIIPSHSFNGDINDAITNLLSQSKQWNDWVGAAQEHMLQHVFIYQNSKREQFKQPIYQMLLQVFNHGTYHRGQLVTMLRQLGIEKIPQTDFLAWSRKK